MTVMDRIHGRVKNGSSKSICVQHIGMGMTIELRNVRKPGDLLQLRIRRLGKCQNVAGTENWSSRYCEFGVRHISAAFQCGGAAFAW